MQCQLFMMNLNAEFKQFFSNFLLQKKKKKLIEHIIYAEMHLNLLTLKLRFEIRITKKFIQVIVALE